MSELVERAARAAHAAIEETMPARCRQRWEDITPLAKAAMFIRARAVLEALREPTDAMLAGACEKHLPNRPMHDTTPPWPDERYRTEQECPRIETRRKIWDRMLEAELGTKAEGEN